MRTKEIHFAEELRDLAEKTELEFPNEYYEILKQSDQCLFLNSDGTADWGKLDGSGGDPVGIDWHSQRESYFIEDMKKIFNHPNEA